ncbi:MAG: hypothetical protein IPN46_15950 [Saprospiraceae bacterium]|nr:hypothetical protein [Saprospiraceae bacterium]
MTVRRARESVGWDKYQRTFSFDKTTERFYNVSVINTNSNNLCIRGLQYAKGKTFVRTFNDVLILDIVTSERFKQ